MRILAVICALIRLHVRPVDGSAPAKWIPISPDKSAVFKVLGSANTPDDTVLAILKFDLNKNRYTRLHLIQLNAGINLDFPIVSRDGGEFGPPFTDPKAETVYLLKGLSTIDWQFMQLWGPTQ